MSRVRITLVAALAAVVACGQSQSLVGGVCAPGYVDCDDECVSVASDPNHCGGCGVVCASGECLSGACMEVPDEAPLPIDAARARERTGPGDASHDARPHPHDAGVDAHDAARDATRPSEHDAAHEAPRRDAPTHTYDSGARAADAGPPDALQDEAQRDARADTERHDAHWDDASRATRKDADVHDGADKHDGRDDSARPDAAHAATPDAAHAATPDAARREAASHADACCGSCAYDTDPMNCGRCGHVCVSGLCGDGTCTGSTSGDIVVIGHDYAATSPRVSEATILSNAVLLPPSNPLQVLSFDEYSDATQLANVKGVLTQAAATLGRTVQITSVTEATDVPGELGGSAYDVLLVSDQADAPPGTLAPLGVSWATALAGFLAAGGDVVVLDGASGAHAQMAAFLDAAGLLDTSGETAIADGTELRVMAYGDAVGNSVVSPYAAQADTVSLITSEAPGPSLTFVVDELTDAGPLPVVIHKTVTPP